MPIMSTVVRSALFRCPEKSELTTGEFVEIGIIVSVSLPRDGSLMPAMDLGRAVENCARIDLVSPVA